MKSTMKGAGGAVFAPEGALIAAPYGVRKRSPRHGVRDVGYRCCICSQSLCKAGVPSHNPTKPQLTPSFTNQVTPKGSDLVGC